nr:uncharacterized protein LOC118878203 [Drosophila suzukii]
MAHDNGQMPQADLLEQLAIRERQLEQLQQAYVQLQGNGNNPAQQERLFKNINRLATFTGTGEISINSFFSSVEYLLQTVEDPQLKREATRTIFYRTIQGQAKDAVINIPEPDNWDLIKATLKLRYRPDTEPHQIYKRICDLRVNSKILTTTMLLTTILMTMAITTTAGTLTIQEIPDQDGYAQIEMKNQDIIITTDIVVHIINLKDIDNILNEIGKNIEMTNNDNKHILQSELTETKNKLYTLYGNHNRGRRGLINVVGSSAKWLFGTMDDEDRKEVENHISTFKENMQETDEALNKQIYINKYTDA